MKRYFAGGAIVTLVLSGCGSVDPALVQRPDGVAAFEGDRVELVAAGEVLWNDNSLGTAGVACASCHANMNDAGDLIDPSTHVDGKVDIQAEGIEYDPVTKSCTGSCHTFFPHENSSWQSVGP